MPLIAALCFLLFALPGHVSPAEVVALATPQGSMVFTYHPDGQTAAVEDADGVTTYTPSPAKSFTYDLAGRTTSATVPGVGTTTYSYDTEGRLTQALYPNLASDAFAYNGLGARVAKADAAGAWSYRRAGAGATSPVLSDGFVSYTPVISERRGGASTFSHSGLKSFDAQTDASGAVSGTRRYDAFGNVASSSGWSGPFGYGGAYGYQEDSGSGLRLLGHRYYDSSTGRFLTRDPAYDGRNWYAYCGGNPVAFADPSGRWFETLLDIGGAIYDVGEFIRDPNLENGLMLAWSIGAIVAPGVPGSYVGRIAKGGLGILDTSSPLSGPIWKKLRKGQTLDALKQAEVPGVYIGKAEDGRFYVGRSKDVPTRAGPGHHKLGSEGIVDVFPMPGSTKLEQELVEQDIIEFFGLDNLANERNAIGLRRRKKLGLPH